MHGSYNLRDFVFVYKHIAKTVENDSDAVLGLYFFILFLILFTVFLFFMLE